MITFEDFLKYIFKNKLGKFIFYDKYAKRVEYKEQDIKKEIIILYDYIKSCEIQFKKDKWIKLISRDNCSTFFTMFALFKAGYNVVLSNPKDKVEDDLPEIDSNIYYKLDKNNYIDKTIFNNDNQWSQWIGFYSSGSTGLQKKFIYKAESILKMLLNIESKIKDSRVYEILEENEKNSGRIIMSTLPMYHILGFLTPVVMYSLECDVVYCMNPYISNIIETIKKENVLGVFGVPIVWELIKNISNRRNKDSINPLRELLGDKLQIILSGGSKTKKELREYFLNFGINFFVGYGMTELGFLSLSSPNIEDINSEGNIYPMYDYKIIDSKGNLLSSGEGELAVDTKGLFSYHLNKNNIEKLELLNGKYFKTGDIFILKNDKLYFKGRKKNIIVSSNGENIFVEDIESNLDFLKEKKILYCVAEDNEIIALYLYNYSNLIDNKELKKIIEYIEIFNKKLYISSKIKEIILINEEMKVTSKGRLTIYNLNENSDVKVVKII